MSQPTRSEAQSGQELGKAEPRPKNGQRARGNVHSEAEQDAPEMDSPPPLAH